MELTVISPDGVLLSQSVRKVTFPGGSGEFTILPHHAALASTLTAGKISYLPEQGKEVQTLTIIGGFAEVEQGHVAAYVELVEPPSKGEIA